MVLLPNARIMENIVYKAFFVYIQIMLNNQLY
jgi:hypothetical protein